MNRLLTEKSTMRLIMLVPLMTGSVRLAFAIGHFLPMRLRRYSKMLLALPAAEEISFSLVLAGQDPAPGLAFVDEHAADRVFHNPVRQLGLFTCREGLGVGLAPAAVVLSREPCSLVELRLALVRTEVIRLALKLAGQAGCFYLVGIHLDAAHRILLRRSVKPCGSQFHPAFRIDEEIAGDDDTLSGHEPLTISTLSPKRQPVSTVRGSKNPLPRSTNTVFLSPESRTASAGTVMAGGR